MTTTVNLRIQAIIGYSVSLANGYHVGVDLKNASGEVLLSTQSPLEGTDPLATDKTFSYQCSNYATSFVRIVLLEKNSSKPTPHPAAILTLPLNWFPLNTMVIQEFPMRSHQNNQVMCFITIHISDDGSKPFEAPEGKLLVIPAWNDPVNAASAQHVINSTPQQAAYFNNPQNSANQMPQQNTNYPGQTIYQPQASFSPNNGGVSSINPAPGTQYQYPTNPYKQYSNSVQPPIQPQTQPAMQPQMPLQQPVYYVMQPQQQPGCMMQQPGMPFAPYMMPQMPYMLVSPYPGAPPQYMPAPGAQMQYMMQPQMVPAAPGAIPPPQQAVSPQIPKSDTNLAPEELPEEPQVAKESADKEETPAQPAIEAKEEEKEIEIEEVETEEESKYVKMENDENEAEEKEEDKSEASTESATKTGNPEDETNKETQNDAEIGKLNL